MSQDMEGSIRKVGTTSMENGSTKFSSQLKKLLERRKWNKANIEPMSLIIRVDNYKTRDYINHTHLVCQDTRVIIMAYYM